MSVKIVFQPDNKTVTVLPSTPLSVAAGAAGIVLDSPCGGRGSCGKCPVKILSGKVKGQLLENGFHLACQTYPLEDLVVEVPAKSRFFRRQIMARGWGQGLRLESNIHKVLLKLPEPTLGDPASDADRLVQELAKKGFAAAVVPDVFAYLPRVLRENGFQVTAVIDRGKVIAVEGGDTRHFCYGMAFDVGTTTVVGMLASLTTGDVLATLARLNPQSRYGDDVITRVDHSERDGGLEALRSAVSGCLAEMIGEACRATSTAEEHLYEVTVAGNTVMTHLLWGVPVGAVARAPYVPAFRQSVEKRLGAAGLPGRTTGSLRTLPNIAGFVGGDTVGAILATGVHESDQLRLLVDIGTNGEVVLGNKDRLLACSTAAGPAFEGARISHGMPGAKGAIEKVMLTADEVQLNVIGGARPRGICGSGVIDTVGELVRNGVVDETGRLLGPEQLGHLPEAIRRRVVAGEQGFDFILWQDAGEEIRFTQKDVRELQLGKAAIRAGIEFLLGEYGVTIEQVREILLAGAFGNYVRRSQAKRIGLLPDVPSERIRYVGNAAGEGALRVLVSCGCRQAAERISRTVKYLELASKSHFQAAYLQAMTFLPTVNLQEPR